MPRRFNLFFSIAITVLFVVTLTANSAPAKTVKMGKAHSFRAIKPVQNDELKAAVSKICDDMSALTSELGGAGAASDAASSYNNHVSTLAPLFAKVKELGGDAALKDKPSAAKALGDD